MPKRQPKRRAEDDILRDLLGGETLPRDALPYTEEFQQLRKRFVGKTKHPISEADFWRSIVRVAKRGGLARKGRQKRARPAPPLTTEQQLEITRLLPEGIGSRDRLPYTDNFDRIHRQFSRLTHTKLTKYEFWRVLSRVAKRSRKPKPIFTEAPRGDLPRETVETLERLNPWWRAEPARATARYRRWAFGEAERRLESELIPIVAIRGPRQVGKSTILNQLIEQRLLIDQVAPARILRVQFDEVPQLGSFKSPLLAIVRWFEKHVLQKSINRSAQEGEPVHLFFDELQNLKDWAPELKLLVDHTSARTLVTGSSSLRILRGRDSLAGRLSVIELGPLRLREIAGIRGLRDIPLVKGGASLANWMEREFWMDLLSTVRKRPAASRDAFRYFSQLGGYPVCHNNPKAIRSILAETVVETVVERTIEHDEAVDPLGQTWNKMLLREVFRQVCRYAGQSVKAERICEEVNNISAASYSKNRVERAIQFLVDAMLVHRIMPLEAALKKQSNGAKLCLSDHFVREAWLQEKVPIFPHDLAHAPQSVAALAGHIMESVLGYFFKSISGLDVTWFPQRAAEPEVDYVLTIGLRRIPIEVKYSRGKPTGRQLAGLESFCSQGKYNAPFGLLITQDSSGPIRDSVLALPAATLLSVI